MSVVQNEPESSTNSVAANPGAPGDTGGGTFGLTSQQAEAIASGSSNGSYGSANDYSQGSTSDPLIRRRTVVNPRVPHGANADGARKGTPGATYTTTVPLSQYTGEFYTKWQDPGFVRWFASRAIAIGANKATDSTGDFFNTWVQLGKDVAALPTWTGTPEQFLEWKASGKLVDDTALMDAIQAGEVGVNAQGQASTTGVTTDPITGERTGPFPDMAGTIDELSAASIPFPVDGNGDPELSSDYTWSGSPSEQNAGVDASVQGDIEGLRYAPISTQTNVDTVTMSREAAYAAADQIAQSLLGRMASDKELAAARKAMNRVLKSSPTVARSTRDATDPDNVSVSTHTDQGASPSDAADAYKMAMQRSSEGMAFNAGKMIEQAMRMM